MSKILSLSTLILAGLTGAASALESDLPPPESIKSLMTRVCDWQLENVTDTVINRSEVGDKSEKVSDLGWIRGAFYVGVIAQFQVSKDARYLDVVRKWGEKNGWQLGPRLRHADDQTVAQVYADLHFIDPDANLLRAAKSNFDLMIADPHRGPDRGWSKDHNWSWCDALFMAPPAMARVARASGEPKYLDLLNTLWWDTHAYLYDQEEHLFYRDANFMAAPGQAQPLSPGGKKIFWGRGNAWVLAGLARTLEYLPEDLPDRPRYIKLFREMSTTILLPLVDREVGPFNGFSTLMGSAAGPVTGGTLKYRYTAASTRKL